MHLYKVTISASIKNTHYYIVAQGFDEAESIAVDADLDGTPEGMTKSPEEQIHELETEREALTAKIEDAYQEAYETAIRNGDSIGLDGLGERAR